MKSLKTGIDEKKGEKIMVISKDEKQLLKEYMIIIKN